MKFTRLSQVQSTEAEFIKLSQVYCALNMDGIHQTDSGIEHGDGIEWPVSGEQ